MASGSGWNLWVWLAGSGCGWNLWVWLVGVFVRRYIDFLILLIPTPLVSALSASLLFVLFKNVFHSCYCTFCNLCNIIVSLSINTHTGDYRRPTEAI